MINKNCLRYGTEPSLIRELFAYGLQQAKKVGPENVFDYSMGNPSIPSPAKVNRSIHEITDTVDPLKLHGYTVAAGIEEVRQSIADSLNRRFHCGAKASELFLTCGCAPALVTIARALTSSPEDEFIINAPYFPEYNLFFSNAGAQIRIIPADTETFQLNFDRISQTLSEHTSAVVINSPNNPSGVVYTEETLQKLAGILTKAGEKYGHPIYVIADEPYRELAYDGVQVPFVPNIYPNTIVCYSWSKSLSLPGERLGYFYINGRCADAEKLYAAACGAAREIGHVNAPSLIQRAVGQCVDEMPDLEAYDKNRTLLYNSLISYGYECPKPDGAFYLLVKAPGGDAEAFSEKAKLKYNLLLVPCTGFGCPGYLRVAYCVSYSMIQRSLPAFKALIEEYRD